MRKIFIKDILKSNNIKLSKISEELIIDKFPESRIGIENEIEKIKTFTNKGKIPSLNELEWINGKIYANIYQRNGVAIIDPKTGAVEGVIDFTPLRDLVTKHKGLDVLNGIAYNPETETIFVTGKRWDKLFEVTISKAE